MIRNGQLHFTVSFMSHDPKLGKFEAPHIQVALSQHLEQVLVAKILLSCFLRFLLLLPF